MERYWLAYTPVWGVGTGLVMVSGWAERWGDLACMVYGVLMAAGAILPAFRPHPSERGVSFGRRAGVKLVASVVVLSFGLNYLQTPFFFDVLHMHFGFDVTITIDRNPAFLYLVTVAYFSTYAVLCMMALRALRARGMGLFAWALAPMAMAFFEAVLNANPFTTRLFCYDDLTLVLTFGTVVYGFALMLALPVWMHIDEGRARGGVLSIVAMMTLAVVADRAVLEVVRVVVAPRVTTVVEDAPGLRDFEGSCLR